MRRNHDPSQMVRLSVTLAMAKRLTMATSNTVRTRQPTTMSTAVVSLLTGRHIRPNVAMTGEVTLRGRVLPVGGIKQKVLAAHRAGITDVIIPKRNEGDLEDVPAEVLAELRIHPVATLEEALAVSLEPSVHWEELAVS